mgnify:CR=1 FL=1
MTTTTTTTTTTAATEFDPHGPVGALTRLGIDPPGWAIDERRSMRDGRVTWAYRPQFVAPGPQSIAFAHLIADDRWRGFIGSSSVEPRFLSKRRAR